MAENTRETGLIAKLGDAQVAPPWGLAEMALAIAVLLLGTLMIGTGITVSVSTSTTNPDPISFVMGWFIGLIVVLVFVLVRWRRSKEKFDALMLRSGLWHPLLAFMVGLGGAFSASLVVGLASGDFLAPIQVLGIDSENIASLVLVGIFVLVIQPIAESLVFSAITLPRLRATLGAWAGLVSTIILYAIYYYLVFGSRGTGNIAIWYGAIYPLIVGFTLSAVRIWSHSSLSAILAQVGVGASVIIIMIVV